MYLHPNGNKKILEPTDWGHKVLGHSSICGDALGSQPIDIIVGGSRYTIHSHSNSAEVCKCYLSSYAQHGSRTD